MEDYFSIDDILASEPRVYCTFHFRGHNLAHLDLPGAAAHWASNGAPEDIPPNHVHTNDLPPGHRVALPYWLSESLSQRGAAAVELPKVFGTASRNSLRADARAVRLHHRCPSFYGLGVKLAGLVKDVGLSASLVAAFAARCWGVVDSAVFAGGRGVDALDGLEEKERALFFAAHGLEVALRRWKERRGGKICGAESLLGKRRREEDIGSPVTPAPAFR